MKRGKTALQMEFFGLFLNSFNGNCDSLYYCCFDRVNTESTPNLFTKDLVGV